ncbi:MAG: translocation/assembly module TamB domain-containing protein, partial [Candidatus Latescibacterota bacterium]
PEAISGGQRRSAASPGTLAPGAAPEAISGGQRRSAASPGAPAPGAAHLEFDVPHLDLSAPLSHLTGQPAQGWLAAEGRFDVPLARLDSTLSWRDLRGELLLRGLHAAGVVGEDSVHVDVHPGWRVVAEEDLLDIQELRVQAERYDRDRREYVAAGSLVAGGRLEGRLLSRLQLSLQDLDLVTFGLPEGKAAAQVSVGGSVERPEMDAQVQVETEDLGTVVGHVQGDVHGARLRGTWTTLLEDSLVVDGEVPWDWAQGSIDSPGVRAHLRSPGFGLFIFADQLADLDHLSGRLVCDLEVRGLGDAMDVQGYIGVLDLEFALLDTEPIYRFPHGRIDFRRRRADLGEFVSPPTRENGRMELTGHFDLSSLSDPGFSLHLATDDAQYRYEEIFSARRVDLDLTLDGSLSSSRLSGQVSVRDALAEPVLVALGAPPVPPPPPALQDPFLENMRLDVTVDIRDLAVDSELATAKAEGAAEIGGTFYKPVFQGDAEILEGQVYLLNREFDFQRGRIVLNNLVPTRSLLQVAYDPFELDPELDMVATTKVVPTDDEDQTEHTVTLTVGGTALNPGLEFTSDPALDFYSILRLLAFGTLGAQEGTSDYTQALGTAAGQLLAKHVEDAGLDEFVILPSGTYLEAVGQPSLRLGKYFDEIPVPIWVRYEAPVRLLSTGEVRVERRLLPYLTLTGSAHSAYDRYGLGLSLKKEF